MHELSIACSLVEAAAQAAQQHGATRVTRVHLKLGVLSGVDADALRFSYDVAAQGTLLEGSQLEIDVLPALISCHQCGASCVLPTIQDFRCPACGAPSHRLLQGREIEIAHIEIEVNSVEEQATTS
ncbi:MAG: hydrogenase maturation nickel metallochaperone HypA [Thermoflexales bacterium]